MESRLEKEMLVSALRLFQQAKWPGDDMMLKHVMLLSFAYVFDLDAQQEAQRVTWLTGNTLVARKSEKYITISGIRWFACFPTVLVVYLSEHCLILLSGMMRDGPWTAFME